MSRGGGGGGRNISGKTSKMTVFREKFSDDTRKSKTSTDAEAVVVAWGGARKSRTGQRKAAGHQKRLLERLGFGEGTGHGRVLTGALGEAGVHRDTASRQAKAARSTGARER